VTVRYRQAGWFWQWGLNQLGCVAIAMPWRTVYLMPKYFHHEKLRLHEAVHVEQMQREGTLRFCVLYLYWLCKYGYWEHPFELEAYRRSGDIG
jgi:hypothetical protein